MSLLLISTLSRCKTLEKKAKSCDSSSGSCTRSNFKKPKDFRGGDTKKKHGKKYSLARLWEKTDKWGSSLKEHTRKSSYAVPGLKRKFIFILNITKHCLFSKHLFAFRQWRLKVRGFLRSEQRERKKKHIYPKFHLNAIKQFWIYGSGENY